MRRAGRSLLLAAAVALLILPAVATAKPKRYVIPGSFGIAADLPKSHGYSISLIAGNHEEVQVIAFRRSSYATFSTKGQADESGLQADFGRYGQFDLSFEPRGEAREEAEPGCKGRPSIFQDGVFRGVIRFRGERDFITVARDGVKGTVAQSFRRVCTVSGGSGNQINVIGVREPRLAAEPAGLEEEASVLDVRKLAAGRQTFLSAISLSGEAPATEVVAGTVEHVGGVEVGRLNSSLRPKPPATFSEPGAEPATVSVEPGGTFLGRARYEKRPGKRASWSGNLRVLLPGLGPIALTGPGFHATLCQMSLVKGIKGCRRG